MDREKRQDREEMKRSKTLWIGKIKQARLSHNAVRQIIHKTVKDKQASHRQQTQAGHRQTKTGKTRWDKTRWIGETDKRRQGRQSKQDRQEVRHNTQQIGKTGQTTQQGKMGEDKTVKLVDNTEY